MNVRPLPLLFAAVVLVGSGCSPSDDPTASQPIIRTSGGAAAASAMADTLEADSKMIAPFAGLDYVYEGELPALDSPAESWKFTLGDVPVERVKQLAAALGVSDEIAELPEDTGGGWLAGPFDYSGPTVTVSASAAMDWWYSPATTPVCVDPAVDDGGIVPNVDPMIETPVDPATGVSPELVVEPVVEPVVAAPDAPTEVTYPSDPASFPIVCGAPEAMDETGYGADPAVAKTKGLMEAAGFDLPSYEFEGYDGPQSSATAWLLINGMRAPFTINFGFTPAGDVSWASGILATPAEGPSFDRIGTTAAFERLQDDQLAWMTSGGGMMTRESTSEISSIDTAATVETADPGASSDASGGSVEGAPVDAPESTVAIAPERVTLTSVTEGLSTIWADDGTVWLLPAYTFGNADGMSITVLAVADGVVANDSPDAVPQVEVAPAG